MATLPKQMTPDELASELYQFFREAQSLAESAARLMASVMAMPSTQPIHVQRFVEESTLREDILNFHVTEPVSYHETADRLRVSESTVRRIVEMARAAGDPRATYNPDTPGRSPVETSHTHGSANGDDSADQGDGGGDASATSWVGSSQECTGEPPRQSGDAEQARNEAGSTTAAADPVLAGSVGEEADVAYSSPASRDLPAGIRVRARHGKPKFLVELHRKTIGKVSIGTFNTREEAVQALETALERLAKGRHPKTNVPLVYANAPVGTMSDIKEEQGRIEATFTPASEEGVHAAQAFSQDLSIGYAPQAEEGPQAQPETFPEEEVGEVPQASPQEGPPSLEDLSDDEILAKLKSGELDAIALMEAEPARYTHLSEEDEHEPRGLVGATAPTIAESLQRLRRDETMLPGVALMEETRVSVSPQKIIFVDEDKHVIEGPKGRVHVPSQGILRMFRRLSDGSLYDATTLAQVGGIKVVDLPGKMKELKPRLAQVGVHLDDSMRTLFAIRRA